MSPFVRNLAILAVVALAIVLLNQETALVTAATLLRFAFFIVIGVVAYFYWRDFGRREIETWPTRPSRVFYAAVALFVVDIGWCARRSASPAATSSSPRRRRRSASTSALRRGASSARLL